MGDTDTARALLRAVLEDPGDDLPRLALADWWEEEGRDPGRAEFVRVQLELERVGRPYRRHGRPAVRYAGGDEYVDEMWPGPAPPAGARVDVVVEPRAVGVRGMLVVRSAPGAGPDAPRRVHFRRDAHSGLVADRRRRALLARERDLLAAREWLWLGGAARRIGSAPDPAWRWRRGFVEATTLTTAEFLRVAPDLFKVQPVTGVTLTDKKPGRYSSGAHDAYWRWFEAPPYSGHYGAADELPGDLWRAYAERTQAEQKSWVHPTEADALAALSRSAVALGRVAAGLPPLA